MRNGHETEQAARAARETVHDAPSPSRPETPDTARARLIGLSAEIGEALASGGSAGEVLGQCTTVLVRRLGAAFARIWTLNPAEQVLELQASSGQYTHLDGRYGRIAVGRLRVGYIAQTAHP
jgi:hypothetical protein